MVKLWQRIKNWRRGKPLQTITAIDFAVREGDKIEFYSSGGAKRSSTMVATTTSATTLTIRGLRWYERLWGWLHFHPKRYYRHPKGTLDICHVYSSSQVGSDEIAVVPNTRTGQLIKRFYDYLHRHAKWIARYDFDSLDIREGEYFPMHSGSYWWFMPFRFANRFFPRVDGMKRREWPDTIE